MKVFAWFQPPKIEPSFSVPIGREFHEHENSLALAGKFLGD